LQRLREIMGKLKLTVNEDKTRICKVPEGEFAFLGYTFGRMCSARTGKARIGYRPSKKSVQRAVRKSPRADRPIGDMARDHNGGGRREPRAARMGELLFRRDRQHRRIGRSMPTQRCGCAGGCASSTKSGDAKAGAIHSRNSMSNSGSYA
jgi:hypothetical protein